MEGYLPMSETERSTSSGSVNPLEDAAAVLTDTMFDAAQSLLKAQHEITQALLTGPRDAPGVADEDGSSEPGEIEQAAARSIKPDESVEDGPEGTPTDAESVDEAESVDDAESVDEAESVDLDHSPGV
jgi:hypothetical protein